MTRRKIHSLRAIHQDTEAEIATVKNYQQLLADMPAYAPLLGKSGPKQDGVDGIHKEKTNATLSKFQSDHGLTVTGKADAETVKRLQETHDALKAAQPAINPPAVTSQPAKTPDPALTPPVAITPKITTDTAGVPIITTGDPVRDAVMKQAIANIGVRDSATRDSALQHYLTRGMPQEYGIKLPGLPATGNDACSLMTSAIYQAVQGPHDIQMVPYDFNGAHRLAVLQKLAPAAVHKLGDGYVPQPGDMFIVHHPGDESHAGIVAGYEARTYDSENVDKSGKPEPGFGARLHTVAFERVIWDRDAEHHLKFDNEFLPANNPTEHGTFYIVDISKLPGHDKLAGAIRNDPKPVTQFPSFGGPHPDVVEDMYGDMKDTLSSIAPYNQPVAAKGPDYGPIKNGDDTLPKAAEPPKKPAATEQQQADNNRATPVSGNRHLVAM